MTSNEYATQQARALSRDYAAHVLGSLAAVPIPENTRWRFLQELHIRLSEARTKFALYPYEHVELISAGADVPDDKTEKALSDLSRIATTDLGDEFTIEAIERSMKARRAELTACRVKLTSSRTRRFKSHRKRRHEWATHLKDTLSTLDALPASGSVFEGVFKHVLGTAGFTRQAIGMCSSTWARPNRSVSSPSLTSARSAPPRRSSDMRQITRLP